MEKKEKKGKKEEKKFTINYSLKRLCSNWLKFQFDQRKKISRPERVKIENHKTITKLWIPRTKASLL